MLQARGVKEKTLLAAVSDAAQWKATDPRVAKAHENLADYYSAEGRYADAERVYQKTLELNEDMLGRANPAIIPAIDDLARVNFAQMKYDQAAELIARELRIMEREYGDNDPKLVPSLEQVARVLQSGGKVSGRGEVSGAGHCDSGEGCRARIVLS